MDFPVRATEKVQHVCAFGIDAMNFLLTARLQPILTVQFRIRYHQRERCFLYLGPVVMTFHFRCSTLFKANYFSGKNLSLIFNPHHSIEMIFLKNVSTSGGLVNNAFSQLKKCYSLAYAVRYLMLQLT